MGYQIATCGGMVVSGIATGIDGVAMKGALTAGGTVVGVLGCGADVVYPGSNRWLYADTERYGCLLTEFPPGTPPVGPEQLNKLTVAGSVTSSHVVLDNIYGYAVDMAFRCNATSDLLLQTMKQIARNGYR